MSVANPTTLSEWASNARSLDTSKVFGALKGVASLRFYEKLTSEDFSKSDIETIVYFYARRYKELGERLPSPTLYDLKEVINRNEVLSAGIYDDAKIVSKIPEEPDDIDREDMSSALEDSYPM